ncbi:MAG: hypothetical protein EOO16_15560 [Chitinophagaceae bacterium]|nr:MAG: hypothetical protein EOO16_15560 [Chitinophagaceae bacterium]
MIRMLLFLFGFTLLACNGGTGNATMPGGAEAHENGGNTLALQTASRAFSNAGAPDRFRLELTGDSILLSTATFTITTAAGEEIYRESFPARMLLDNGFNYDANPGRAAREAYIRQRVAEFFRDANFRTPAIDESEIFQEDQSDKAAWNDIRSDRSATGFFYQLGEEDGRNIAWSKRQQKVLLYLNCC